jgi:gamma-glutamylputrescine oxidase
MSDPDIKAYGDSWYAATMMDVEPRPRLAFDLDVDVCVIGGGLAGLTTARELARSGWSVVLIEAGRLAQSASGRNTGFVLPGFGADADRLIARIGFERTKDLWTLAQAGLDYVRNAIRDNGSKGIDPQPGWLYVSKKDNTDEFLGYVALLGELGCEIEGWPTERVRSVLRSERYFYAINYLRAFAIHPLNYALSLAAAAERDGARIFENTPAVSIDPAGVRKRIVTPGARLRASHVVLCGNFQIDSLIPRLGATLVPVTTYVITTAPLGASLAAAVGYHGAVSDTDLADNHYRIVGGDRLMFSGRSTAWARNPRRYVRELTADIKKTYPQLGDAAVDYAWSGTLGIPVHRMPQIGELDPGVWLASGFGGHGLNTSAMAGNLIARAIVDGDQTWRQFTPYELVWAGGVSGRIAAQLRVWIKRFRDGVEERRAKARELAHRQAREAALARETQAAEEAEEVAAAQEAMAVSESPVQDTAVPESVPHPTAGVAADSSAALEAASLNTTATAQDEPRTTAGSIIPPPSTAEPEPQPQPAAPVARRSKRKKRRQNATPKADEGASV